MGDNNKNKDSIKNININKKNKKNKKNKIGKVILLFFLIFLLLNIMGIAFLFFKFYDPVLQLRDKAIEKVSHLDTDDFAYDMNTYFYYDNGDIMMKRINGSYKYTKISNVSNKITHGYVAVEDKEFYYHKGYSPKAITRAILAYVKNKGTITQGGSTITQQVVKNNILSSEQTITRKISELFGAIELEKLYSKSQIMEMYLNSNFYGSDCYGIEAACEYYFGCTADDVTWAQAATLIGISNAPTRYNPESNYDKCLEKRNAVLNTFKEQGLITEVEYEMALNENLELYLVREQSEIEITYEYTYALNCAVEELMQYEGFEFKYLFNDEDEENAYNFAYNEKYKECKDKILYGGYKVYTSINKEKQDLLQNSIDEGMSKYKEINEDTGIYARQSAGVCVDNQNNYIIAIVGGRTGSGEYNRAYQAARQPGSSIKPVLDYATSFNKGSTPSTIIKDSPLEGDYSPKNWTGGYAGNISIRKAIFGSVNTTAAKALREVGIDYGLSCLSKMRFSHISWQDNNNLAISIGGFTNGVTVVEMTKAYNTMYNDGLYSDKTCIKRMVDKKGNAIREDIDKYTEVYDSASSYMITSCMQDNFDVAGGFVTKNKIENMDCAGKTGTTNSNKDAYFCGYTPYYTCSIWIGFDNPQEMSIGSEVSADIWQLYMEQIHADLEPKKFIMPNTVEECYVDWQGKAVEYNSGQKDLFRKENITLDNCSDKCKEIYETVLRLDSIQTELKDLTWNQKTESEAQNMLIEANKILNKYNSINDQINSLNSIYERKFINEKFSPIYKSINSAITIIINEANDIITKAQTTTATKSVTQPTTKASNNNTNKTQKTTKYNDNTLKTTNLQNDIITNRN